MQICGEYWGVCAFSSLGTCCTKGASAIFGAVLPGSGSEICSQTVHRVTSVENAEDAARVMKLGVRWETTEVDTAHALSKPRRYEKESDRVSEQASAHRSAP